MAARAQALIETHRPRAWMDADRAVVQDPDPILDARDQPLAVARRIRRWKTTLAVVLGQANGCVAYTLDGGKESAIVLVGRARDRAAVTELWDWLVQRIERLSATHGAGKNKKWHEGDESTRLKVGVVLVGLLSLWTIAKGFVLGPSPLLLFSFACWVGLAAMGWLRSRRRSSIP